MSSYIEQSLTSGEKVVYIGRFHWIYLASAVFWIILGFVACIATIAIASFISVKHGIGMTYPNISAQYYAQAWDAVVTSRGGYLDVVRDLPGVVRISAFAMIVIGLLLFLQMMVVRATTEIAVTTSRFVLKEGIIARNVDEMNIDRIESVHVIQSILGRMLGFGTVMVRGMGVGEIILPPVANPINLRNAIDQARQIGARQGGDGRR